MGVRLSPKRLIKTCKCQSVLVPEQHLREMFTHTKTEVDCSPGASTEKLSKRRKRPRTTRLAKAEGAGEAEEEADQPDAATCDRREEQDQAAPYPPGAQPRRHLDSLTAMDSAPKRKRSGITPDSCGKAGDPHNLEGGALAVSQLFHLYQAPPHSRFWLGPRCR